MNNKKINLEYYEELYFKASKIIESKDSTIANLLEQLKEANEVIEFYANNYEWETWKAEDFKAYGGKKAKEYVNKYVIKEKK